MSSTPNTPSVSAEEKQVQYGGFIARGCAMLIDMCFAILLMIPIFMLLNPLIYGGENPQHQLQVLMIEALQAMQQQHITPSFSWIIAYILQDPRSYAYFITDGMLYRILLDQCLQIAFFTIAFLLCWVRLSTTPGKMLLSLKIVDATTHAPLTPSQSVIRSLGYLLAAAPVGLGFVWAAFDRRKQGLHDKLANTVVIKG